MQLPIVQCLCMNSWIKFPRSVDRKKRIIEITSKVTRPVALGLLFLRLSKMLDMLEKDM